MLDHIRLFVSDVDRSKAFYELAFQPLGYRVLLEPAPGIVGMGRDFPNFWLAQTEGSSATAHVAIQADTRSVVDEFHAAALAAGGTDNGPPGLRRSTTRATTVHSSTTPMASSRKSRGQPAWPLPGDDTGSGEQAATAVPEQPGDTLGA